MPHGTLDVVLANDRNLKDKDLFGKMDPFVELIIDSQKQRSKTHQNGGKSPVFNQTFMFNILDGCNTLHIEAWDDDNLSNDHIGSARISLDRAFATGIHDEWFQLVSRNGKPAGQLHLCLNFTPRTPIQPPGNTGVPMSYSSPAPQQYYGNAPPVQQYQAYSPPPNGVYSGVPPPNGVYGGVPPPQPMYGQPPGVYLGQLPQPQMFPACPPPMPNQPYPPQPLVGYPPDKHQQPNQPSSYGSHPPPYVGYPGNAYSQPNGYPGR